MRKLHIASIRVIAHDIVGSCSDYQIMFCAQKAYVLGLIYQKLDGNYDNMLPNSLEDLTDFDLEKISTWMSGQRTGQHL